MFMVWTIADPISKWVNINALSIDQNVNLHNIKTAQPIFKQNETCMSRFFKTTFYLLFMYRIGVKKHFLISHEHFMQ